MSRLRITNRGAGVVLALTVFGIFAAGLIGLTVYGS
jgi:hypothetical protein